MAGVPRAKRIRHRPVAASRTTTCPDCGAEVGVSPEYNHSINSTGVKPGMWRVAIHPRERVRGAERCAGSRTFIDAITVVEKKRSV